MADDPPLSQTTLTDAQRRSLAWVAGAEGVPTSTGLKGLARLGLAARLLDPKTLRPRWRLTEAGRAIWKAQSHA